MGAEYLTKEGLILGWKKLIVDIFAGGSID